MSLQIGTGGAGLYHTTPGVMVVQPRVGAGAASYSGPFDGISFAALYGMKRFLSAYTGNLIRIRRSSDNAEQNIGYDASTGLLDTAAISAFIGGGNGFVTTWYDQSGNTRNATQTTAADQPRISVSGAPNSQAGLLFTGGSAGGSQTLGMGNISAAFSSAGSMIAAYDADGASHEHYWILNTKNGIDQYWYFDGSGTGYFGVFRGTRVSNYPNASLNDGAFIVSVISNATNYTVYHEGTSYGAQAADFNAGDNYVIGGESTKYFGGYLMALALLNGSISAANHNTIGEELEALYNITWTTV
jgi:hypothetical protein